MLKIPAQTKSLYLLLLGTSLALALIPALYPHLDIAVAAFFLRADPPLPVTRWLWIEWVNEYTPDIFRVLVMICLFGWIVANLVPRLRQWSLMLAFVGLSVALGPGLATWAVKEHHQRARPFDVVEFGGVREFSPALVKANQCEDNCAFVSGHVACGFFFASLMLLYPRRRWWWLATGVFGGLAIGLARMAVGAHWLSDVLWALPITLLSSWLVWHVLALFYRSARKEAPEAP